MGLFCVVPVDPVLNDPPPLLNGVSAKVWELQSCLSSLKVQKDFHSLVLEVTDWKVLWQREKYRNICDAPAASNIRA
jgi:hypothetical protein